jgi:hypothetical protein
VKVTVRQDRMTIDTPSIGLILAALDTASEAWLERAAVIEAGPERKALLKMAGEAKALSILIENKQDEKPEEPA